MSYRFKPRFLFLYENEDYIKNLLDMPFLSKEKPVKISTLEIQYENIKFILCKYGCIENIRGLRVSGIMIEEKLYECLDQQYIYYNLMPLIDCNESTLSKTIIPI